MSSEKERAENLTYLASIPVHRLKDLVSIADREDKEKSAKEKVSRKFKKDMDFLSRVRFYQAPPVTFSSILSNNNLKKIRAVTRKYPAIKFVQLYKIQNFAGQYNSYITDIFPEKNLPQNIHAAEKLVYSVLDNAHICKNKAYILINEPNVTSFHEDIFYFCNS